MNIQKPIIIEFTGTPDAGKTTLIHSLSEFLQNQGFSVQIMQEDAELVPKAIPKSTWVRNVWITLGQLQSLLVTRFSTADIVFLDRGYYDALFWASFHEVQGHCSPEESSYLTNMIIEISKQFDLVPDYLFIIDVSAEVSLKRRALNHSTTTIQNDDFINLYKQKLDEFYETIKIPNFKIDTSEMTIKEVHLKVLEEIFTILKNFNL